MENLSAPVSESSAVGEYLKGNRAVYRALRNTFNQAQSAYRQLMESPEAMVDNQLQNLNGDCWQALADQCQDTLINTSKDVEILCWLTTARIFSRTPLASLDEALQAFVEVVTEYGDQMHPRPPVEKLKADDETGQAGEWTEFRTRPLIQLLGESDNSGLLFMPLQNIPLIGDITYARYFSAERAGSLGEVKAEAQQLLTSERSAVIDTLHALASCKARLETLRDLFAEQCQAVAVQPVNFSFLLRLFDQLLNALRFMLEDQLTPWPLDPVAEAPAEVVAETVTQTAPQPAAEAPAAVQQPAAGNVPAQPAVAVQAVAPVALTDVAGAIQSRDQAFQNLRQIADYFRQTEPHSPVYMLIERAIRWGYLPLPELLAEMVGDNASVMARIETMAGLENNERIDIPGGSTGVAPVNPVSAVTQVNLPAEDNSQAVASEPTPAEPPAEQTTTQNISSFEW